jgi:peptidoglycan/LPS O-acetylase OafA/YrhL
VLLASTLVKSPWQRFLAARPVVIFGRISYGVYLWQQLATYPVPGAGFLFYLGSISACVIFCLGSFYYFEKPLIAFGHELSRRLQTARALNNERAGHA